MTDREAGEITSLKFIGHTPVDLKAARTFSLVYASSLAS